MASAKQENSAKDKAMSRSARKVSALDHRPSKKLKTAHSASSPAEAGRLRQTIPTDIEHTPTKIISILRRDEPTFPRGGASVLTPLEHKQIKIEAQRDVLFEQAGSQNARAGSEDYAEDGLEKTPLAATKRKRSMPKSAQNFPKLEPNDTSVRIEGLSYKVEIPLWLASTCL